jgi:PAS domain S-box-containing protein
MLVTDFLRAHREAIVRRWEDAVRHVPGLEAERDLPSPVLRDHLPEVLISLADWMDRNRVAEARPQPTLAVMHGRQRFALGFDLRQVVREYGELRRTIILLMIEHGAPPAVSELVRLGSAVDAAISEAAEEYHQARSRALEQSEDRLRMALSSARAGIWDLNPLTGELQWDARSRELFGVAHEAPVDESVFLAHVHPEDRAGTHAAMRDVLEGRRESFDAEYRTLTAGDDGERWVRSTGRAYFDAAGRAFRFTGMILDISEGKRAEAERDLLLGVLGHDLRDPLAAMKMAAELLLRSELPPQVMRTAARIVSSADRMGRLIGQLLDYIRSRAGRIMLERRWIDLREVCSQAIGEAALLHPGRAVELVVEGDDPSGSWDADRMARLVGNLVNNAFQHGAADRPVRVTLRAAADEVAIEVRNAGPPIPPALLPHIFDPFRRATDRTGGLGLGLYISRQIAEAHGGRIGVRSNADETVLAVTLPRRAPDHQGST